MGAVSRAKARSHVSLQGITCVVFHHAGPSLYGAALTTAGSCFPLIFCRMKILRQMGELIIMCTITALLLGLTFLGPLLAILCENPLRVFYWLCRSWCRRFRAWRVRRAERRRKRRQEKKRLRMRLDKARRLRYRSTDADVVPPIIPQGNFHLFLSHTWVQGEDEMRAVKLRLVEMMPEAIIFLDKDDLKHGAGADYVDKSSSVLAMCTVEYFRSRACARELFRAVLQGKPLIALLEPDERRGGLSRQAIAHLLISARFPIVGASSSSPETHTWTAQWALDGEVLEWGFPATPTGEQILSALFMDPPIEWNRLSAFQDVTMRLIASRLLPVTERDDVYIQDEVGSLTLSTPPLPDGCTHHLYYSANNRGAEVLVTELQSLLDQRNSRYSGEFSASLKVSDTLADLEGCKHMLLYLTNATWTSGEVSAAFVKEIEAAQKLGIHLLAVHEFPSILDDSSVPNRGACHFNDFWKEGWTPKHLLSRDAHVYKEIAIALKPGAWRVAGLATVIIKMCEGSGESRMNRAQPAPAKDSQATMVESHDPATSGPKPSAPRRWWQEGAGGACGQYLAPSEV